ncbi:hypothetical protein QM012_003733 [Aureobasidium pullulans]|uniref:Protein kinase domain-containing protein n=1 Tax=Aureobasidium pullulans TaxID=5580 RepID=A0ABR0T8Q6_AURPU
MEVLEFGECFPDDPQKPIFTIVVYKIDDDYYTARISERGIDKSDITRSKLEDVVIIPKTAFQPRYSAQQFTLVQPTGSHFVKRASLISYHHIDRVGNDRIAQDLLQEAQVCEWLRRHSHRNIAEYIGCETDDGRIAGLCFTRYKDSLMQRLNPGSLNERAFAASAHIDQGWCNDILTGIKNALHHLHSLNLVHNDLNPANIMLDHEDIPKLIDFGSCRQVGETLKNVGRTYEWYDERVQYADKSNDLDALSEIGAWMRGEMDGFKFEE